MNKILQTLALIVSMLPLLIQAIRSIEIAMPEPGQGAAKLAILRGIVEGVFAKATDLTETFEQIWPAVEKVIASIVAAFNKIGSFGK